MPQQASERDHAPLPTSQTAFPSAADSETGVPARRRDRSRRRIRALLCAGGAITAATALGLTAMAAPPAPVEAASVTGSQSQSVASPDAGTPLAKPQPVKATAEPAEKPAKKPAEKSALDAPLDEASVASPYGNRINPLSGNGQEMHTGTDYAGACGTPVLASDAGTVTESGWHPYGGGQRIVVDHGKGLKTTYNHLSSLGAAVGDTVDRGKPIGAVGTTGNSTGCHLHFEVVVNGKTVDPSLHL